MCKIFSTSSARKDILIWKYLNKYCKMGVCESTLLRNSFVKQGLYSLRLNRFESSLAKCYSAIGLNVVTEAP